MRRAGRIYTRARVPSLVRRRFVACPLTLQRRLIHLANVEVGDAIGDLSGAPDLDAASLTSFKDASTQLTTAQTAADETARVTALEAARQLVNQAATGIGTNLSFTIGEGSVMF